MSDIVFSGESWISVGGEQDPDGGFVAGKRWHGANSIR